MKFNMKNRPKAKLPIIGKPDKDYDRIEVTGWFEGFEKELREIRKMGAEGRNKRYKHPTNWITDQVLDDILGDSE